MTGHVDGVGTVDALRRGRGAIAHGSWCGSTSTRRRALARFIAAKGSIAVDGVSLTVNGVAGARFPVNLIPHTLAVTTLKTLHPGRGSTSRSTSSRATSSGLRARSARQLHGQADMV